MIGALFLSAFCLSKDVSECMKSLGISNSEFFLDRMKQNASEFQPIEFLNADAAFAKPSASRRKVIISMRWQSIEDQIQHFIFGAAIANALGYPIHVEMRRYPLSSPQPNFLVNFSSIPMEQIDYPEFLRVRVAKELICKNSTYFSGESPILIRNFDDIASLYASHFFSSTIRSLYGLHSVFFLAHKYILRDTDLSFVPNTVGVCLKTFQISKKSPLNDHKAVVKRFAAAIKSLFPGGDKHFIFYGADSESVNSLAKLFPKSEVLRPGADGMVKLLRSDVFVGTFQSPFASLIHQMRGVPGYFIDSYNGTVIKQRTSLSGLLSPFLQNVEEMADTANEKLRSCKDNIEDLRIVIDNFLM